MPNLARRQRKAALLMHLTGSEEDVVRPSKKAPKNCVFIKKYV